MPLLVVEKGHDKGRAVSVPPKGTVLLGRDSSTALPLRDTMASRMHCKIESREDGYYLTDLESLNGTYLNGARIRDTVKLSFGDLVKVGETLFTFQSDEASTTTLAGQRIGGYRILERLGRGGMGTVYKAEQIDLQRPVALKVISEEHTKDKDFIELFIHEARAAAKLNHPNVVQVYDVKRHNDVYYFSMEYVSGGSVQDVLNKQRRVPVDQAVRWILDAARGLDYAHKKGIVHRDVKPDNLMISETGMVKIGDMGLARGLNEKVGPEEETSVIGTPHYIAPEQVLGRPADFRSDIYSLGATAYRMLAGVTPFQAPSVRDLVNKKVREDAPSVRDFNPEVPEELARIVTRMMERDPDKRYQTMAEVVADLERFQRGQAGLEAAARGEGSTAIQVLAANKKLLMAAVGLLIVVVVGGIVGASFFRETSPAPPPPTPAVDPRQAQQALEVVVLTELKKMDRSDPRSIEKVMEDYTRVIQAYPGTDASKKAAENRAALARLLREVRAEQRFKLLEAQDVAQWRQAVEAAGPAGPDLSLIEATAAEYEAFAGSEEARGTPAAERARARADHIRRWKAAVERQRGEFESAVRRAQGLRDQKKYGEAWNLLTAFQEEARKAALECDFARDRYRSILYDQAAARELEALVADARFAWGQAEEQARALAREKNFEAALRILDGVLQDSVPEVAQLARPVKEALELEAAAIVRAEEMAREAAREAARARARAAIAQESRAIRELSLRFDFKGALQRMKALRDAHGIEEFRERLERRVAELERCAHLKESLINVINARVAGGINPHRFKSEFQTVTGSGTIESADEKSLKIRLSGGGGTLEYYWSEFTGAAFYEFIKRHWKYSKEQNADPNDRCNLAALCMEFGLYEDALAEIESVLASMKDPAFVVSESVRRFCLEYKDRIERGESAEEDEIEAQKRLVRLELFMKNDELNAARREIDLLRSRYGRTDAVRQAQVRLEEHAQKIRDKGGELLNRTRREERWQRLQTRVGEEAAAARRAYADVAARLARIEDPFERNVHLGAAAAAVGDWRASTDRYLEARRVGDAMMARREVGRDFARVLGEQVYGELYRNYILLKDRKSAEAVRADGARRFINPDTRAEEEWWTALMKWLSYWAEEAYPVHEKRAAQLREEVRSNPEEAQKIWALAQSTAALQNFAEARGYYAYLLENHPEFSQVQNGNCLYALAELLFAARDVTQARKRYQELEAQHRQHAKVVDAEARDGVKRRLDECYKLIAKMGYASVPGGRK